MTQTTERTRLTIANFMDSSLYDLVKKGVFDGVGWIYNPDHAYARVIHFTPHRRDEALGPALAPHGIEIRGHDASGLSPLKILRAIGTAWRAIGVERVDIVRGRLPYLGSLIGGVAARLRGRPFVVSLGGDNRIAQERNEKYYYNSRRISYLMEWTVLMLATAIIVPNRYTAEYVARILGQSRANRRCVRIPWILPPPRENGEASDAIKSVAYDKPILLIVGFLNKYKYIDVIYEFLIAAFATDSPAAKVRYVFCGDGPLLQKGRALFAENPNVSFLGWTSQSDVRALMKRAEVVLIPMSGYVLLEAASLGKAVVTSNVEWHGELVTDGETGFVVAPDNPVSWRAATEWLLSNRGQAARFGAALRQRYLNEYAPEKSIAAEINLYYSLVNRKYV